MTGATVRVTGVGSSSTIQVNDDGTITVADALDQAGIDAEAQGLDVRANGEEVSNPSSVSLQGDSQVTVVPKKPNLG